MRTSGKTKDEGKGERGEARENGRNRRTDLFFRAVVDTATNALTTVFGFNALVYCSHNNTIKTSGGKKAKGKARTSKYGMPLASAKDCAV